MKNRLNRRASPGLVVGCLALAVALGGTAVALPGTNTVDSGDIKKNAVRSGEIKNKQVKPGDLSPKSFVPRAFAHVTADNTVTAGQTRGITGAMVNVENDFYCFNVPFNPRHVQATIDHDNTTQIYIQASLAEEPSCAGSEDASVRMLNVVTGNNVTATNFFIALY